MGEPLARLVLGGAAQDIGRVPHRVDGPHAHLPGLLEALQGAVDEIRPLDGEESRPLARDKGRLGLLPGPALEMTARLSSISRRKMAYSARNTSRRVTPGWSTSSANRAKNCPHFPIYSARFRS